MKIGIISDTHDSIPNLLKTIDILNQNKVKKVYFCGDLCAPFTLKFFKKLKAPVAAVYGNNEGDKLGIQRRINKYKLNIKYAEKQGLLYEEQILDFNLAVYHGHVYQITQSLLKNKSYNLLLTGHTHIFHVKKQNKKIWINPGTVCGFSEKLSIKPSFAIFNLKSKKTEIIYL